MRTFIESRIFTRRIKEFLNDSHEQQRENHERV